MLSFVVVCGVLLVVCKCSLGVVRRVLSFVVCCLLFADVDDCRLVFAPVCCML